ncbi:YicC/YloC family endoribonuclease [Alkalibaculum sporogenes]|nr:YicC/YloC family endoribonuclease [Alkalibaculum sporogenes]
MTGFGRGEYKDDQYEIIVEIKSINHRYKDFFIKIPRQISMMEENIRRYVSEHISRGRVEVNIKLNKSNVSDKSLYLNNNLAQEYIECLNAIKNNFNEVTGDISLSLISRFPDIITTVEDEVDLEYLWKKIKPGLQDAVANTLKSRESEGDILKTDFEKRLQYITGYLDIIIKEAPNVTIEYKKRLEIKMREYTQAVELDEVRLLNEVAIFSDKVSVDEEITRLKSHIERFYTIMSEKEPVGRKIDFLIQEMNREINTIGSKSNSIDISNSVVDMKSELEKMREQIQNIE